MSTATRVPLTKPRWSQLILEGTGALIAAVLLVWLLFWFIWQHPKTSKVIALYVPESAVDVPYMEADVQTLSGSPAKRTLEPPAKAEELPKRLADLVGKSGSPPIVITIAQPWVQGQTDGDSPLKLIQRVAESAHRHVLLVLDQTQVDSDRDLGFFGSAPDDYDLQFKQKLAEIKPKSDDVKIFVLCSSAPGQKSWMADGLGRSYFLYYVQRGLTGDARGWDPASGLRNSITVKGLFQYVLKNVEDSVSNQRQALQTPWLYAVGKNEDDFSLPPIAAGSPVERIEPKTAAAEPPADSKPAKTPPPEVDEPRALLARLFVEWDEHDKLLASTKGAPYRVAPAAWRLYESWLLKSERRVRFAWNDSNALSWAEKGLSEAARRREIVKATIEKNTKADTAFPFKPVLGDDDGKRVLFDSLLFLTGRGPDELATRSMSSSQPRTPGQSRDPKARKPKDEEEQELVPPTALREAATAIVDSRYLELQLPAWAYQFADEFEADTFFKDNRLGGLLRVAVLKRLDGEAAIARDMRGLDWIRPLIRDGDAVRREVQDAMFDLAPKEEVLERQTSQFGRSYGDAARRIDSYHRARSLLEEIAAELPYYGEWVVLDQTRIVNDPDVGRSDVLKKELDSTVAATAALITALERGHSSDAAEQDDAREGLTVAFDAASDAFRKLEKEYSGKFAALASNPSAATWRELDDVLQAPLIPAETRRQLVRQLLAAQVADVSFDGKTYTPAAAPLYRMDRGFWRKANGLARLEVALLKLAAKGESFQKALDDVSRTLADIPEIPASVDAVDGVLDAYDKLNRQVRIARSRVRVERAPDAGQAVLPIAEVGSGLRAADRAVRLLSAWELARAGDEDGTTRDLERLARLDTLLFHADRLAKDYARDVGRLIDSARSYYDNAALPPISIPGGILRTQVDPDTVRIDDDGKAAFRVQLNAESQEPGVRKADIPEGNAFVGAFPPAVEAPKPDPKPADATKKAPATTQLRLSVTDADTLPRTYRFVGMPLGVGKGDRGASLIGFSVRQLGDSDGQTTALTVKTFYRGRIDESSVRRVALVTRDFGTPVTFSIAQDRERLDLKFGPSIAKKILDQFKDQQDKGYMHFRQDFPYVLTFKNQRNQPAVVTIQRALEPEEGGVPPRLIDRAPLPRRLEAKEEVTLKGQILARDVPVGKPMKMTVRVASEGGDELAVHAYVFEQLAVEQYINIRPHEDFANHYGDGRQVPCFILDVARNANDPVTEPIFYRDFRFSIDNKPARDSLPKDGLLDRGKTVPVTYPIYPDDKKFKYRVIVDGYELPKDAAGEYTLSK